MGEEIEPYLRSAHTGGQSRVYREGPVAVASQADPYVAVPLAVRSPGSIEERHRLFRMTLTVRPETASDQNTTYTSTAADWIVENRSTVVPPIGGVWVSVLSNAQSLITHSISTNPMRGRLAQITQRPNAQCPLPDPTEVISPLLIAWPQGAVDPEDNNQEVWLADTAYRGLVRQAGAAFIDRDQFEAADLTAMSFVNSDPGFGGTWSVANGEMRYSLSRAIGHAIFGEAEWNHVRVQLSVFPGSGNAGVAVSVVTTNNTPTQALYAMVRTRADGSRELALLRKRSAAETVELASSPLSHADDWVSLIVDAFDDEIRVTSGEVVLQAAREELREGRLALIGTGGTRFRQLKVEGLDLYAMTFLTSRYRSFSEHIQSYDGTLRAIMANDMGPGLVVESVSDLWGQTGTRIVTAMIAKGSLAQRQALFLTWTNALGLPLVQEVTELRVSRVTEGPGIDAFLVESPEPIDYSEEVVVRLEQWVRTRSGHLAEVTDLLAQLFEQLRTPQPFDLWRSLTELNIDVLPKAKSVKERPEVQALLDKDLLSQAMSSDLKLDGIGGAKEGPDFPRPQMVVTRVGKRLHVRMKQKSIVPQNRGGDTIEFAEFFRQDRSGPLEINRWRGTVEVIRPGTVLIRASRVGRGFGERALTSLTAQERDLLAGVIVAIDPRLNQIIDWYYPNRWVCQDVALQVLQDETAKRALLIPMSNGETPQRLSANQFRLNFTMDRVRWKTTDVPDEKNHYHDDTTIELAL